MKTLDTKWMLKVAGVAILSSVMITGCGGGSKSPKPANPPVVEPDPVLPPDVGDDLEQVVSGSVVRASDGTFIDGAVVRFIENGAPATNITDTDGNVITSVVANEGLFEVMIKAGAEITSFRISATADGFIEKGISVDVVADAEIILTQVELVASSGTGVATAVKDAVVSDAVSSVDIVFDTDEGVDAGADTTLGSAVITIPANTQLQDELGNPVDGSSVTLQVTYVEERDSEEAATSVAAAIPAGINEIEESTDVSIPLAVAQINLVTDTGTEVKQFSTPITVSFNLPEGTLLRSTGQPVSQGDSFRVKSYDEDDGFWVLEDEVATVGAKVGAVFPATFELSHLTFFALTDEVAACSAGVNVNLSGDTIPAGGLIVRLFSRDLDVTTSIRPGEELSLTAAEAKAVGVAQSTEATLRIRDADGNIWGEVTQAICGDVDLALTSPNLDTVDEDLTLTAVCSNDTTVITAVTGALVQYRADDNSSYRIAPGNGDGTYSLTDLASGVEYSVVIDSNLSGVSELQTTITADGTGEELEISLECNAGTGSGGSGGSGG